MREYTQKFILNNFIAKYPPPHSKTHTVIVKTIPIKDYKINCGKCYGADECLNGSRKDPILPPGRQWACRRCYHFRNIHNGDIDNCSECEEEVFGDGMEHIIVYDQNGKVFPFFREENLFECNYDSDYYN